MINHDNPEHASHCRVRTELRRIIKEAKILDIELIDGWYYILCSDAKLRVSNSAPLELRYDFKVKSHDLEIIFQSATALSDLFLRHQAPIRSSDILAQCIVVAVGWKPEESGLIEISWVIRRVMSESTWKDAPLQVINEKWVRAVVPMSQLRQ